MVVREHMAAEFFNTIVKKANGVDTAENPLATVSNAKQRPSLESSEHLISFRSARQKVPAIRTNITRLSPFQ
jgi:hypothetical protein